MTDPMDTPSLIERLDKFLRSDWKRDDVPAEVAELVADAAEAITQLTEERDDTNGFSWHERWRMAVDGANVWRDEAEALRARVESLERVLREAIDALGDMMNEHTPLGQHENGEIEYCNGSACLNADRTMSAARALLTEDRPAEPTVQEEKP